MDNKIREIILAVAEKKTKDIEEGLLFNNEIGYHLNTPSYGQLIGLELIENKIDFESLYDKGYAKGYQDLRKVPKKEHTFAIHYVQKCKEIPSDEFLSNYMSIAEQQDFLIRVWNKIDMPQVVEANSFTVMASVSHILRDFKKVGVQCCHLSPEIDKAFAKLISSHYINSNYLRCFLFEDVYFDNSTLELLKKSPSQCPQEEYLELTKINDINVIKANHKVLDITLKEKPEKSIKRKI